MATDKTIPWGGDNPGEIKMSADNWYGNEDVTVSSDENLGTLRSKPVLFYATGDRNIVSPPVRLVQLPATARAYWADNGEESVELGASAGTVQIDVETNVSSDSYIKVEFDTLPTGWSLSSAEPISNGYRYTLSYATATATANTVHFILTVGRLEPIVLSCTQPARSIVRREYTRWSSILEQMSYVPLTGFYAQWISAAGATWSVYALSKTKPTRTRTDYYNNGDVDTVTETMPDDTTLTPVVLGQETPTEYRQILTSDGTYAYQTTLGAYINAAPATGCGVLFKATSLGTNYFESGAVLGVDGVSYGLQVTDSDTNATYLVFSSQSEIPEQDNLVESYSTAQTSGTWSPLMVSGSGTTPVPLLGAQGYSWEVTAMFLGTFTSGAQGMVNAPQIKLVMGTQNVPSGYEYTADTNITTLSKKQAAKSTPVPRVITISGCGASADYLQCSINRAAEYAECTVQFIDHSGNVFHSIPSSRYKIAPEAYRSEVVVIYINQPSVGVTPTAAVTQQARMAPYITNEVSSNGRVYQAYGPYLWYNTFRTNFGTGDGSAGNSLAPSNNSTAQTIGQIPAYKPAGANANWCGWLMRLTEGAIIYKGRDMTSRYLNVTMNLNSDRVHWCIDMQNINSARLFPIDPNTNKTYAWIENELTDSVYRRSLLIEPSDTYVEHNIPQM